jgi:hypothetical protein
MDENTITPSSLPPRRELFTQPSARAVWAAVCALDVPLQWDVLRELQTRLAAPDLLPDARVARCVLALKEAADALGRSPGAREYEEMRETTHRAAGWPSAHTVRRVLAGTWNDCLRHAALATVADGDAIVFELGSSFTREEAIEALNECRRDLQRVPSLTEYLGWTRRPDVKRRDGRRPSSQGPFDRLFGGYLAALEAAGLCNTGTGTWAAPRSTHARAGAYRQTDEAMLESLREVADRIGHSPTTTEYAREREITRKESEDAGGLRVLPSYGSINQRFGGWEAALAAAGLEPANGRQRERERPKGRPSLRRIPDETMRQAVRDAYADLGRPFTATAYKSWREKKVAEDDGVARLTSRYPSYHSIWARYCSWEAAVAAALTPDEEADEPEAGE